LFTYVCKRKMGFVLAMVGFELATLGPISLDRSGNFSVFDSRSGVRFVSGIDPIRFWDRSIVRMRIGNSVSGVD
jgi:hypothetical protein